MPPPRLGGFRAQAGACGAVALVAGAPGWVALVLQLRDFGERHLISGPVARARGRGRQ